MVAFKFPELTPDVEKQDTMQSTCLNLYPFCPALLNISQSANIE